jgi:ParB family transcriptional regulator, chromosome partitioning protein
MPARVAMDDLKLAELMGSMKEIGLIQPVTLIVDGPRYRLGPGHRRFTAAINLGWREITALVYQPEEYSEHAAMLAENRFREDMSAAEEAIWFAEVREKFSLDEDALCKHFNVTPDYLGDRLRLLRGDNEVFRHLLAREINFSVARELNKCEDEPHRRYLLDIAVRCGYPARVISDMVRQWRANNPEQPPTQPAPTPAASAPLAEPFRVECALCGGGKDPWNLIDVKLHKWEWEWILKQLKKQAEGGECDLSNSTTVN